MLANKMAFCLESKFSFKGKLQVNYQKFIILSNSGYFKNINTLLFLEIQVISLIGNGNVLSN